MHALLADEGGLIAQHPVAAAATAAAIVAVALFHVYGGSPALTGAAVHAFASTFALLILSAGLGTLLWFTLPLLIAPPPDGDTIRHVIVPVIAVLAWVLMVLRLRAGRRGRKWRVPPVGQQVPGADYGLRRRRSWRGW